MRGGTAAMVRFPVGPQFFSGSTNPGHVHPTRYRHPHAPRPKNGCVLTTMAGDQRRDCDVDWDLYQRLKSEGRLNLLFRLSEPAAARWPKADPSVSPSNVLPFISRAEHLAWRERWKNGRWVKLSWTPEERNTILRQDEAYRQADARWQMNHGPVRRGADVVWFSRER
jgi:hypothetical protein